MLDFNRILTIVRGASDAASALDSLVDVVAASFGAVDQATLKESYAEARRNSDVAHSATQAALDAASRR